MKTAIFVCALSVFVASSAHANIRITEVMSSSNGGGVPTSDWFEMTNYGSSAIDLTGWRMDDGSVNPLASVALNGVSSIGAGQSIIFIESAAGAGVASFGTFWGLSATTAARASAWGPVATASHCSTRRARWSPRSLSPLPPRVRASSTATTPRAWSIRLTTD